MHFVGSPGGVVTVSTARLASSRALDALESKLTPWRQIPNRAARPHGGWIRAIREALGMTADDLATRMGVAQSSLTRLEKSEQARTIRLDTLARAAEAMECDLVYALVPRRPLGDVVSDQAGRRAMEQLQRLGHTMALEEQTVDTQRLQADFELLRAQHLNSPGLWHQPSERGTIPATIS
jgi:predicted DNA-binding mobile mystery protein A